MAGLQVLEPLARPGQPLPAGADQGEQAREFGALGGGVFWSLILVIHMGATTSVEGSMLWTLLIFLTGFFSWMRDVPGPYSDGLSKTSDVFLLSARAFVQVALALMFLYPM